MDGNPRAQVLFRPFSNVTQRDHRHIICETLIFVSGKLARMTQFKPQDDGLWCRIRTEEPVEIGTVQKATIVGVRTNAATSGEQSASGARGREIVAWRGIDGVLKLSEARCPHQFVHLASSGTVDGCELVCTAHFWRFTASGAGSIRDSSGHREPVSALSVFPSSEADENLWAYLPFHFVVLADQSCSTGIKPEANPYR